MDEFVAVIAGLLAVIGIALGIVSFTLPDVSQTQHSIVLETSKLQPNPSRNYDLPVPTSNGSTQLLQMERPVQDGMVVTYWERNSDHAVDRDHFTNFWANLLLIGASVCLLAALVLFIYFAWD